MMTGYISDRHTGTDNRPRTYRVVERAGGWSIALNGACTRPFPDRAAALRIASALQRQADALRGRIR